VVIPVLCDVDDGMIASAAKELHELGQPDAEKVKDFRRVMDRKDIDAVIVATPDHWHALNTIHACQAGKDVYCEKPLATSVAESRALLETARRHERIVQMGTQWRSGPHYGDAINYVHSGRLGRIRQVRCWAYLVWAGDAGRHPDADVPAGVDYDMWLGPAPERPFNRGRFHFSFRWFWDYAGGLMTDWGVHLINLALWGMKHPQPLRIMSGGGKYKLVDDMSETPDTQSAVYEFPDFMLTWEHYARGNHGFLGREHGVAFHGTDGVLVLDGHGWEVMPEAGDKEEKVPREKHSGGPDGRQYHTRNFLDCMRSRQQPVENAEVAHYVSTVALLGNVALRSGQTIQWNPTTERATNDADNNINRFLSKPYRSPWKLPS
jgi:predicted dehydrogenase